jgi:hypothetical protein
MGDNQFLVRFASSTGIDGNGEKTYDGEIQDMVTYRKHFGSFASDWLNELAERVYIPVRRQSGNTDEENLSVDSDREDEIMEDEQVEELEDENDDEDGE